ncbi:ATP-binding cassette domain-containing protein [Marinomonas sp.]|nr:ATP-binding cassette domain-containing protein [Marinomonas sp.]MDB4837710.1 ATP-binding cassette domain-containing protein [Marinomonas sp.]
MFRVKNFSLSSNEKMLINSLSFDINKGEVLSLMGPSGIGKSSLLHFLSGHLAASLTATGEVFFG